MHCQFPHLYNLGFHCLSIPINWQKKSQKERKLTEFPFACLGRMRTFRLRKKNTCNLRLINLWVTISIPAGWTRRQMKKTFKHCLRFSFLFKEALWDDAHKFPDFHLYLTVRTVQKLVRVLFTDDSQVASWQVWAPWRLWSPCCQCSYRNTWGSKRHSIYTRGPCVNATTPVCLEHTCAGFIISGLPTNTRDILSHKSASQSRRQNNNLQLLPKRWFGGTVIVCFISGWLGDSKQSRGDTIRLTGPSRCQPPFSTYIIISGSFQMLKLVKCVIWSKNKERVASLESYAVIPLWHNGIWQNFLTGHTIWSEMFVLFYLSPSDADVFNTTKILTKMKTTLRKINLENRQQHVDFGEFFFWVKGISSFWWSAGK